MNKKMLPCPFCGGEAKVIKDSMLICGHRYWRIIHNSNDCPITDAFGIFRSSAKYSTAEKAIAAWNRRADARQLALKTRVCPMCEDCSDGCPVETPKDSRNIVTNADRIRGMTDGELQKFLHEFESGDIDYAKTFCDLCCKDAALERRSVDCEGCLLWWLKSDAKQPQGLDYWTKQPAETEARNETTRPNRRN